MTRKASLVVNIRVITKPWRNEEWTLEPGLVGLGDKGPGHGLIVLATIPGSCGDNARSVPLALLIEPDGKLVCDGGVCLAETARCSRRIKSGDLHESAEAVLERWWRRNCDRWSLGTGAGDTMWREVAFLGGYHAAPHEEHRVALDKQRTKRLERAKVDHDHEVEKLLGPKAKA